MLEFDSEKKKQKSVLKHLNKIHIFDRIHVKKREDFFWREKRKLFSTLEIVCMYQNWLDY